MAMGNIFFTSDTHFGHRRILEYSKRPFSSIEEHDEALITRWNETVGKNDEVYHLGDFALVNANKWADIVGRLNGRIHLIIGNHDEEKLKTHNHDLFAEVSFFQHLNIDGVKIYACHYPLLCFDGEDVPSVWNLYGHVHSGPGCGAFDLPRLEYTFRNQYDVGVDNNDYRPVSFEEVRQIINSRFAE